MDLKNFDEQIKSALGNLEVPYEPATWAALESRLNVLQAPADAVDKAVAHRLENLEAGYQPAHWEILAGRMDQAARIRRLRLFKLAEAAIFLLLLLNLDGILGSIREEKPRAQPQPNEPMAQTLPSKGKRNATPSVAQANAPTEQNSTRIGDLVAEVAAFVSQVMGTSPAQTPENQTANPLPEPIAATRTAGGSVLDAHNFYGKNGFVRFPTLQRLQPTTRELMAQADDPRFSPVAVEKSPRTTPFYGATYAAFERNFVREGDYATARNGHGGGFAVGYRKGKWGVEAGLAFSQKDYRPKKEVEIYAGNLATGYYGTYANEVSADVLSVPVKATRRVAKVGQVSAHATAGLTTNLVLQKGYRQNKVYYPGSAPSGQGNPDQQPQYQQVGTGLVEGGALAGNAFFTADAGLRLERPVGRRYVAFVEPAYRQSLGGGVREAKDRLSTFVVQAGVLATL
jgi:hypothetical protein